MNAFPGLIVVTGPTASGKTPLAIELAQLLDGEIINADSVQVYKDFDIGAAKPSIEELRAVRHHLVSEFSPQENFDAECFRSCAGKIIEEVQSRSKLPVICGGTGLYLRALLCGLMQVEQVSQQSQDKLLALIAKLENSGLEHEEISRELHNELRNLDPASAEAIHPHDIQRVKRALLVYFATQRSLVELQKEHSHGDRPYRALLLVLGPPREELNMRINARCKEMLDKGLIEEVKLLRSKYPLNSKPFGAIGYRHVNEHLRGDYDLEKMLENFKRDTRHFAKRQRTWWRNQPRFLNWENVSSYFEEFEPQIGKETPKKLNLNSDFKEKLFFFVRQFLNRQGTFSDAERQNNPVYFVEIKSLNLE